MPEPRFNIVSEQGDGAGFAVRLKDEGYDVRLWIRDPDGASICDNMVEKAGDIEDLIHDASADRDVFVFDVSGNGLIADHLASQGFPVIGGSALADRLERDRRYGYSVMEDVGISTPETKSFTDFHRACDFVEAHSDTRWVYKPSKQLGDLSPSHVSYDADDLIQMLQNIAQETDIANPQFELQAFEEGVALSTELWFEHGELVEPLINHTLERKELMNDDVGPSGGCVGNLTWFCSGCKACRVARQLAPWAEREHYHGMLDLNAIVARRRIYGLEFTPRFGYDATPTLLFELVRGGLGTFLESFARGQVGGLNLREGFAGAVRVTIPPWPSEKYDADENVPIRGLGEDEIRSAYWYNVKKDSDGNFVSAGAWGVIGLITARGSDPRGVMARPLDTLRSLKLKNKQFRTDLHKVFAKDLEKLEELGVEINVYAAS
jgi:phosphoribosylamine--glycine ligase